LAQDEAGVSDLSDPLKARAWLCPCTDSDEWVHVSQTMLAVVTERRHKKGCPSFLPLSRV